MALLKGIRRYLGMKWRKPIRDKLNDWFVGKLVRITEPKAMFLKKAIPMCCLAGGNLFTITLLYNQDMLVNLVFSALCSVES